MNSLFQELNKCGVYQVICNVAGNPSVAGEVKVAMTKDGVVQQQGVLDIPLATTDNSISGCIDTLVQVSKDNGNCCCQSPVTIQFVNQGVGLNNANTSVTVVKIC